MQQWQPVPALSAPLELAGAAAPRPSGQPPVLAAAFDSATVGWVLLGTATPPMAWLLRTEDGGRSWHGRLAWPGNPLSRLRVSGPDEAAVLLGLWPAHRNEINGHPVAAGEPFATFLAGTRDGGATWTLGAPPDRQASGAFLLGSDRAWLLIAAPAAYPRTDLARTADGGTTWERLDGADDLPTVLVGFSTTTDGLLIQQDRHRADLLSETRDGGLSWTRRPLATPPGVPRGAETWLFPVDGDLLTLRAVARSRPASPPPWQGTYAYERTGDGWTGPHRLPMPAADTGPDLLTRSPGGTLWGAAGHDLWIGESLTGPWRPVRVPLPAGEQISSVEPVGDGVAWLTTAAGFAGGGLYRSDDDGLTWRRLTVTA